LFVVCAWSCPRGISGNKPLGNHKGLPHLIEAGRQCSAEADTMCPDSIFCEETDYLLGFFYTEYPKRDNLASIDQILNDMADKRQTDFWRASLIDFLGDDRWWALMDSSQEYAAVDRMLVIIRDPNETPDLRFYAMSNADSILSHIEKNNLKADPDIGEKLQKGYSLDLLRNEVYQGHMQLSEIHAKAHIEVLQAYGEYIDTLLAVWKTEDLHPEIQNRILISLSNSLGKPIEAASEARRCLEEALRNYRTMDRSLWRTLAIIGYENLHMSDMPQVAGRMLGDMHNELKAEEDKVKRMRIKGEIELLESMISKHKHL